MIKINFDEFNKNIDKYLDIATKERVLVKIEKNKSVIIMSERKYKEFKDN